MVSLITAVLFVGYTLVYAAVANGGRLARRPWDALRESAYDTTASTGSGGGGTSTWDTFWGFFKRLLPFSLPGLG